MSSPLKKIAVVIPKYGLVGGGERFVAELTERLAENSLFDIHVFANQWRSQSQNITFHRVPAFSFPRFLTTASFAYWANRLIGDNDFDLVHAHDRIFRADLFTMHGIPHRLWVKEVRRKQLSLFDRVTCWVEEKMIRDGGCQLLLAVSRLAREQFLLAFGENTAPVAVMHPGVAIERFPIGGERAKHRRLVRTRFSIAPEEPVILFVSMNFELKGLDRIMTAMAMLPGRWDGAMPKLLVVGKGKQRKFEKMARRLGLVDQVFFAGVVENDIEQFYLAADIFVMLSGFDTFGMAVLEAMAASLPVIISDRVGARDLVREAMNGFIVDRDDIDTVCDRICFLLDLQNRERLGIAARHEAENHSWDRATERLKDIYLSLLAETAENTPS